MGRSMDAESTCPNCGASLGSDDPQGLCPRCLVGLHFRKDTELLSEENPARPRHIEPGADELPPLNEVGLLFPQLEITKCLGRGGMGMVYQARQPRLNRFVALKMLARSKEADPEFAERFALEARTLAR